MQGRGFGEGGKSQPRFDRVVSNNCGICVFEEGKNLGGHASYAPRSHGCSGFSIYAATTLLLSPYPYLYLMENS